MADVAIVGAGIHPFGRHPASGLEQGALATRAALADAGDRVVARGVRLRWLGGGRGRRHTRVTARPDRSSRSSTSPTAAPTGGSALISAYNAIRAGAADVVLAVGFDKHPRGAFDPEPAKYGIGGWYGQTGLMLTTQFFGMKIQRYMHEHGISRQALAKVAAKAFRNGAMNPNAWRRTPLSEDQILDAPLLADPLTQYMFCSPAEGAVAFVLASSDVADQFRPRPVYLRGRRAEVPPVRLVRGVQPRPRRPPW